MQHATLIGLLDWLHRHPCRYLDFRVSRVFILAVAVELYYFFLVVGLVEVSDEKASEFVGLVA